MNEREVREGGRRYVCSITGKPCRCATFGRRACVDTSATQALSWARTAIIRLHNAAEALDFAVDELIYERPLPAPEWRDKVRRINRLIAELEEETK